MIYFVTFVRPKKNSMTYQETLHYLYTRVPMFQQSGASAYKPGLGTTIALDDHLSNPHKAYKTIHVAGTNGKGSVSHLLAAILRQEGYKVGLYTSPHLLDFRERIRVNGEKASEAYVVDFVERHRAFFEPLHPSFFELTTAMAFQYFKEQAVDIAVIEVGLGGRLDCTNIITPLLGIITNISFDHTQFLGNTLGQIAAEKAGIAKAGVPLLLGESAEPVIYDTIAQKAKESELLGDAQPCNAKTVLSALHILREEVGLSLSPEAVKEGFRSVTSLTGLMGRWQRVADEPCATYCDTGHNVGGWQHLAKTLADAQRAASGTLRMVVGMVADKDVDSVLALMPKEATYYFTQASVSRAMPVETFAEKAASHGLRGATYPTVGEAVKAARQAADPHDTIFIGGSTFIVADALPLFPEAIK